MFYYENSDFWLTADFGLEIEIIIVSLQMTETLCHEFSCLYSRVWRNIFLAVKGRQKLISCLGHNSILNLLIKFRLLELNYHAQGCVICIKATQAHLHNFAWCFIFVKLVFYSICQYWTVKMHELAGNHWAFHGIK